MNLTPEEIRTLDKGEPVSLMVEGRKCVLLTSDAYEQAQALIDDWAPSTMRRHMAEMMAEDWNDPTMSACDD
jgi:hypothetical protein